MKVIADTTTTMPPKLKNPTDKGDVGAPSKKGTSKASQVQSKASKRGISPTEVDQENSKKKKAAPANTALEAEKETMETGNEINTDEANNNSAAEDENENIDDIISNPDETISNHNIINAKINLDELSSLPANVNQVIIASTDSSRKLSSLNPLQLKAGIEETCGPVEKAEYLKSGGIMITVKKQEQIREIKQCRSFRNIPIASKIAWTSQFTYRKIWCPYLSQETIPGILEMLKDQNVIAVRKFFSDERQNLPLYVLTFLGPAPDKLTLGYELIELVRYTPSPMQCKNCWRFGHIAKACRSKSVCKCCASVFHETDKCPVDDGNKKCVSCKGQGTLQTRQRIAKGTSTEALSPGTGSSRYQWRP